MKKLLFIFLTTTFVSLSFADVFPTKEQADYCGQWFMIADGNEWRDITFNISAKTLTYRVYFTSYDDVYMGGGLIILIDKWEFISNTTSTRNLYPNGVKIYGTVVDQFDFWVGEDIGRTYTFRIFLSKDKESFIVFEEENSNSYRRFQKE